MRPVHGTHARDSALWLIWDAFHYIRRSAEEVSRTYGVSGPQLAVLNRVAAHPGLSGMELARRMLTTQQSAHLTLTTLERKGLVERTRDRGAGHIVRARLTEAGRGVVDGCRDGVLAVEARLLSVLNDAEQATLVELLERFVAPAFDATTALPQDSRLLWLIWDAFQYIRRSTEEVSRPFGVSGPQLGVLNRIGEDPGMSGVELARRMLTTQQSAHLTLTTLERKGLVERTRDRGAGHIVRARLTQAGHSVVDGCRDGVLAVEARLLSVLNDAEQAAFVELLERFVGPARAASNSLPGQ